jgi:hypothetical protein
MVGKITLPVAKDLAKSGFFSYKLSFYIHSEVNFYDISDIRP